jgi:hypothetical protein
MSVQSSETLEMPKNDTFLKVLVINNFEATAANNQNPAGTVTLPYQNHWCSEFIVALVPWHQVCSKQRAHCNMTVAGTPC